MAVPVTASRLGRTCPFVKQPCQSNEPPPRCLANEPGRLLYLTRYTLTLTRSVSEDATHVLAYASG